jgi:hypothetical protein
MSPEELVAAFEEWRGKVSAWLETIPDDAIWADLSPAAHQLVEIRSGVELVKLRMARR